MNPNWLQEQAPFHLEKTQRQDKPATFAAPPHETDKPEPSGGDTRKPSLNFKERGEVLSKPPLRPSLLPFIDGPREGCPQFTNDPGTPGSGEDRPAFMELGTDRHAALSAHLKGDDGLLNLLPEEDKAGVLWAAEYIRLQAPTADYPIHCERILGLVDEEFKDVFPNGGTPDIVCGPEIFDLKWQVRDYLAQYAAYAAMVIQEGGYPQVRVHSLFGATRHASVYTFTEASAMEIIRPILADYYADAPAKVCDRCGWCARKLTCPAFNAPAAAVAQGRDDWGLTTYHVTEITTPEDMATAIRLASHLRKWCDAVDHYKREWMLKQGIQIPGYTIRNDAGDRAITDLNQALALSGIPADKFIKACSIGIGALKKLWAEHYGISETRADKAINDRLAPVITRTPTQSIVKDKPLKD